MSCLNKYRADDFSFFPDTPITASILSQPLSNFFLDRRLFRADYLDRLYWTDTIEKLVLRLIENKRKTTYMY
jgi:hypothetical protein